MQKLTNPVPLFLDARGALLDAGKIYVGVAGQDPEASPKPVYWDAGLSQVAAQPLRTLGGVIVNQETPAFVYMADGAFSLRVRDADDLLVSYISSVEGDIDAAAYQPLDSDLTAIAALATTAFGRSLLTLANAAALKAATGIADALPLAGGTVTGNIVRQGAGVHIYFTNPAMTGGRFTLSAPGASDVTSQPGDVQAFWS